MVDVFGVSGKAIFAHHGETFRIDSVRVQSPCWKEIQRDVKIDAGADCGAGTMRVAVGGKEITLIT